MAKMRILSLGAGVQSTALYLMAERGIIEPFSAAIFADTGWESTRTYVHIEWLKSIGKTPILTVKSDIIGGIFEWSKNAKHRDSKKFSVMPFYTSNGCSAGMLKRQCTYHYKVLPITKEIRRLLGIAPRKRAPIDACDLIIGISWDERQRVLGRLDRCTDRLYPLVDMRWTRQHCIEWLWQNYRLQVAKSSCVGCPYHSNKEWREVMEVKSEWDQAIELDNAIRNAGQSTFRTRDRLFLHRSCRPLDEVDLRTEEEKGQTSFDFVKEQKLNIFVEHLTLQTEDV